MTFEPILRSFFKDAGNVKALASEERVWVRTVKKPFLMWVLTLALTCILSPWRGVHLCMILVLRMTFRTILHSIFTRTLGTRKPSPRRRGFG